MIISVVNKKGGVGKTAFSFSIAKDLNLFLQSNDNSLIEQLYQGKAKISAYPKLIANCVYDFGGFVQKGVLEILKASDVLIVPCTPLYNSILRTLESLQELYPVNPRILILITNFISLQEKEQCAQKIQEKYKHFSFFYFKHSKILENSMQQGLSFTELASLSPLAKNAYKHFMDEYTRLLNTLSKLRKTTWTA
ncbi:ParA family protein [Helicobacter suis]|uniref:ParA family protein n=1 Tax=Helicobacter suis TaxID=104628 RepID=UPI0013D5D485|nr:ParA family protein [Helicobacter suis]